MDSSYEQQSEFIDTRRKNKYLREGSVMKQAKQYFRNKTNEQRLNYALKLFFDAINYRSNRIISQQIQQTNPIQTVKVRLSSLAYQIQTSNLWRLLMLLLAYIFMFIICMSVNKPNNIQFLIELGILIVFWIDIILNSVHKFMSFGNFIHLQSSRFYIKFFVVNILTIDQLLTLIRDQNDFRFFIFLRAALPSFYDVSLRQKIQTALKLYKDFFVYVFFFAIVLLSFAIITSVLVKIPQGKQYDKFTQNYNSVAHVMFLFHILSTYDSFPDNQMIAMRIRPFVQVVFVSFLFMNILVFSIIPTTILYKQFRKIYAKQMLLSQIKQQHTLIYVFIALSNEQIKVSRTKLIQFLFCVYRKNTQYIGHIANICLSLNHHESQYIEIYQFIGLCKIIQSNTAMLPLTYKDCKLWNKFCMYVNEKFGLKDFILSEVFKGFIALVILISIVNSLLIFYNKSPVFSDIDRIFTIIFCLQMMLKILGNGFQVFFRDTFNIFDIITVLGMVISAFLYQSVFTNNFEPILKLLRFYRILILGKQFANQRSFVQRESLFLQSARLTNQAMIISPIVLTFFPLLLFVSYVLGVLGMWIFHQAPLIEPQDSPYSKYDQFSNYRKFLYTQFINVQIMVEAGWSSVAFDHAFRYGKALFVIFYFAFCHLIIVGLVLPIFKGIIWDLYETVHDQINFQSNIAANNQKNKKNLNKKREELLKLQKQSQNGLICQTIQCQRVLQNKIDEIIIKRLIRNFQIDPYRHNNIIIDEIEEKQINERASMSYYHKIISNIHQVVKFQSISNLQVEDIQFSIQKLTSSINLDSIDIPKKPDLSQILSKFLRKKFYRAQSPEFWFDGNGQIFGSEQSIKNIQSMLSVILNLKKANKKQIYKLIKQNLIQNQVNIDMLQSNRPRRDLTYGINYTLILRKTFLLYTSQYLIRKFCHQNISSMYPSYFSEMSMSNFDQNLFSWLSRSLYSLKSILRFSQINYKVFFSLLTEIENILSSKVLKLGSIFKFVFELNEQNAWFTVQYNQLKELKIHFIKNDLWIWIPQFEQNVIYTAKDLFTKADIFSNLDFQQKKKSSIFLRQLFSSFQTIALSLKCRQLFFSFDPITVKYNAYTLYKNVDNQQKKSQKNFKISKIMVILLQNERQRDKNQILQFDLTKIERTQCFLKKPYFNIHENERDIMKKTKKVQIIQDQSTGNTTKLPQILTMNILTQVKQIISISEKNLIIQLERLLKETYFNKR